MKVLSLFDGIACGYEALQRAGIKVDTYYASEIDKYAIQIALKNHPDIIEIGDVCNVKGEDYQDIDLLIGGSPCQGFSVAGKQLAFDDPRSKLFFEFVRLLKETKPKYFLLENVKMRKERIDIISGYLGVQPIEINSDLVSAQSRKRLYWTNIPGVYLPENKGMILKDILQEQVDEKYYLNEQQLAKMKYLKGPKKIQRERDGYKYTYSEGGIPFPDIIDRPSRTILTSEGHMARTTHIIQKVGDRDKNHWGVRTDKSYCLPANPMSDRGQMVVSDIGIRKLTPIECERLQTLPDNYTEGVSDTQRYKSLGNGWTVDVIAHIFSFINQ